MVIKDIRLNNQEEIYWILGVQDRKLPVIEKKFKVVIFVKQDGLSKGVTVSIKGANSRVDKTIAYIKKELTKIAEKESNFNIVSDPIADGVIFVPANSKKIIVRNQHQLLFARSIFEKDIVVSTGPAGTGKTFLACACALRALQLGKIGKIVVTRPIVEAGEKLGFLPGSLEEKVDPYLRPIYDAFSSMLGVEKLMDFRHNDILEILPLAYMRGRTLENAFIILDEAQNALPGQIKMFLTRMGVGSKIVINGDLSQIDLPSCKDSGLFQAKQILADITEISFIDFDGEDIVRHPLVKQIIEAYSYWDAQKRKK